MDAADFFSVKYTYITEGFVEHAHSLGKEVCAWTLNYQGDMQRMVTAAWTTLSRTIRSWCVGYPRTTDRNPALSACLAMH